jgi:hypothetical protein
LIQWSTTHRRNVWQITRLAKKSRTPKLTARDRHPVLAPPKLEQGKTSDTSS